MEITAATRVSELRFTDLFLSEHQSHFSGLRGSEIDPTPAPAGVRDDLANLLRLCSANHKEAGLNGFAFEYDTVHYRAAVMPSQKGTVYVLRQFPSVIPEHSSLGIHPGYARKLLQPDLTGLIIVSGATGDGKTTTASSLIAERLKLYGGVAITAEDPPEMPLEGQHGKGICYQTNVDREKGGFAEACRQILRWNPSIIFLGEIRDGEAAAEALSAGINGHLVISTIHADDVIKAIHRVYDLACKNMESAGAASLLGDGLLCVLHQKLEGDPKRMKSLDMLFLDSTANGARSMIRSAKFEQLGSEISLQRNKILMEERQQKVQGS